MVFPAVFDVSNLNGKNGFAINLPGVNSACGIGDINHDGIDDLGISYSGGAYAVYGIGTGWPSVFNVSSLNGANGFNIYNLQGTSISGTGDINGDKIDDFMVGDSTQNSVFVVYGSEINFPDTFNILTLNGQNGFTIKGTTNGQLGSYTSNLGDINNDGKNDIALTDGANLYVIYGLNQNFPSSFPVSTINGVNGFIYSCGAFNTFANKAGNFNDDTFNDIVIGSRYGVFDSGYTELTVLFTNNSMPEQIDCNALNINNSFISKIPSDNDPVGCGGNIVSVTGGKDLNGDNIDDIALGIPTVGSNTNDGITIVYFGNPNSLLVQSISITTNNGFHCLGAASSSITDINDDGKPDLVIGAPGTVGYAAVMYGHNLSEPFPSTMLVNGFNGINGFVIQNQEATEPHLGGDVASAGDINNDGIEDIVITQQDAQFAPGAVYAIFGLGGHPAASATSTSSITPTPSASFNHNKHNPTDFSLSDIISASVGSFAGGVVLTLLGLYAYNKCYKHHETSDDHYGEM